MKTIRTIHDNDFKIELDDNLFEYQKELTTKLDQMNETFNQGIINEIVLWKVNRFASISEETLKLLNEIDSQTKDINIELTRKILRILLRTKGVQLPMASTILRFKNKNIYQIIDQRVYRIIYKNPSSKINSYKSEKNLDIQVELYLKYLADLKIICEELKIPFFLADRILYNADKRINYEFPLDNY